VSAALRAGRVSCTKPIAWPILALLPHIGHIVRAWDPCDRGSSRLVGVLRARGINAIGTAEDFLTVTVPPENTSDLVTNPPYGENKRGELAMKFIEHALELQVPRVAMLLRVDFDSAISRQCVCRYCATFAGKIVLLNRIKWFEGPSSRPIITAGFSGVAHISDRLPSATSHARRRNPSHAVLGRKNDAPHLLTAPDP